MASVPFGTGIPSALIGLLYGSTFVTMDVPLSAVGSLATGILWSLIAALCSPGVPVTEQVGRECLSQTGTGSRLANRFALGWHAAFTEGHRTCDGARMTQ